MLIKGVPIKASWQHVFGVPLDKQPPLTHQRQPRCQRSHAARPRHQRHRAGRGRRSRSRSRAMRKTSSACTCAPISPTPKSCSTASPGRSPRGAPAPSSAMSSGTAPRYPDRADERAAGRRQRGDRRLDGRGAGPPRREYRFPNFSINVITSLEAHGKMRPDGVWEVTAKGPRYDGRDLFQSFFDVAGISRPRQQGAPGPGSARRDRYRRRL